MHTDEFAHINMQLGLSLWDRIKVLFGANIYLRACHTVQITAPGKEKPNYSDIRLHSFDPAVVVTFKERKELRAFTAHMKRPVLKTQVTKTIDVVREIEQTKGAHKQKTP